LPIPLAAVTLHVTSQANPHFRPIGTISAYLPTTPAKEHAMSENNITSIAPMDASAITDDNAVNRLFEITASGENTQELAQLDALVYERLTQAYDETVVIPAQLQAIRAA